MDYNLHRIELPSPFIIFNYGMIDERRRDEMPYQIISNVFIGEIITNFLLNFQYLVILNTQFTLNLI